MVRSLQNALALNTALRDRLRAERDGANAMQFGESSHGVDLSPFLEGRENEAKAFQAHKQQLAAKLESLQLERVDLAATNRALEWNLGKSRLG